MSGSSQIAPLLQTGSSGYPVTDSRVRFRLVDILFHEDNIGWYNNSQCKDCCETCDDKLKTCNTCQDCNGWSTYLDNNYRVDGCKYLNIYIFGRFCDSYVATAGEVPPSGSYVMLQNVYSNYMEHLPNGDPYFMNGLIAHELGHALGFNHSWTTCSQFPDMACSDGPSPTQNMGWCSPENPPADPQDPPCTNNVMGYSNSKFHWTPLQVGHMNQMLVAFYKRRNGWLANDVRDPALDRTISGDETWEFGKVISGNLTIESGATLTVKCQVDMPNDGKVIVKPGGCLIVDGGYITNTSCHGFWPGIEAWGNTAEGQYGNPKPTHQSLVVLKNGAVIANALIGIRTDKLGEPGTTGGVVQVEGTYNPPGTFSKPGGTFYNCQKAVFFFPYENHSQWNPTIPQTNRSFFSHCDFVVDNDYHGTDDLVGGQNFIAHAALWRVYGVTFKGCHFKNLRNGITESSKLGEGIISLDAQFTVSGYCTDPPDQYGIPCAEEDLFRSTFEGFDHGVRAAVTTTDRAFIVNQSNFTKNVVGVYSLGVNSFQVTRSNFTGGNQNVELTGSLDYPLSEQRAIFSTGGHGFRIEENHFQKATGAVNKFAGTWINNSGAYNSQVYKNSAEDTDFGFVGEGICTDNDHAAFIGLQFLCNGNHNPGGRDFWDNKVDEVPNNNYHSIRTQQGSAAKPAGNTFTQDPNTPEDESDFTNNTDWVLNYWYNTTNSLAAEPLDYTQGWVGTTHTDNTYGCPTQLGPGHGHPISAGGRSAIRTEFAAAKDAYVATAYVYNALLDGGNTDVLIDEVQKTWPEDAWQLHDELMAKSPYLSPEVLQEVTKKNIMPQAMLLEVLLANPEATQKGGLIKWLQYEAPNPLPQYMLDLIVGSWEQKTFRTQLESQLGQHHGDMSLAADELISEWKNDTLSLNTDSILSRWQQVPSLGARYSEVLTRLERSEYNEARTLMNGLGNTYKLSDPQIKERDHALMYIDLLANASTAGHDLLKLEPSELTVLREVAAFGCDRPALWAQNLLCFGYAECYSPCTGKGAAQKALKRPRAVPVKEEPSPLTVYPNPATSYVTFAYTLQKEAKDAVLVLRSMEGREVKRMPLAAKVGQQLLDTRTLAPGTYSVELLNGGTRLTTERLVVKP